MTRVSHLYIYPVKSLQGISVDEVDVLERGFKNDRRWMIVDSNKDFITQRNHPQLSQIAVDLSQDKIHLSADGNSIHLALSDSTKPVEVTVWQNQVNALEADTLQNEWISEFLGGHYSFVLMPEDGKRPANPNYAQHNENVSFADGYPYLIIGQSSLDDLNSSLPSPIPMNRFRPNIVVTGSSAYEEDHWREMKIGEVPFYGTHPCKRCIFTTIDQETGTKGKEPLKTLASYRKDGKDVIFGLNALARKKGIVRVGDELCLM